MNTDPGQIGVRPRSDPNVCITGATGFLGWHLAEAFRHAGWRVTAVVRPGNSKPLPPGVESAPSALDPDALASVATGAHLIIHAAGLTQARDDAAFRRVNVTGTEAAVAAANRTGAALLLISSQAASGIGTVERPTREDDAPQPLTAYGRSKLAAERVVIDQARVPWIIVRPSAVYGPRDRAFLPLFRLAGRGLFPLVSPPTTPFTLIHIEDVSRAIVLAATALTAQAGDALRPSATIRQVLFLGHQHPQTTGDILTRLADLSGRRYRPLRVPSFALHGLAWAGELAWLTGFKPLIDRARLTELHAPGFVCDVTKARDVLGFTASVELKEGMEGTARWYRSHGWL